MLDKNNPIPLGVQVKEQIKMLINSGTYREGDKLPVISQMASFLGVNKNTIAAVFRELEGEGYVKGCRGKGVFVSRKAPEKVIDSELLAIIDAAINEAHKRGMTTGELINIIGARSACKKNNKVLKVLFITALGKDLLEANLRKLRANITGVEFEGLFIGTNRISSTSKKSLENADVLVVPYIEYEIIKNILPQDKKLITTTLSLKPLESLRKGEEKKTKVAVIGRTSREAAVMAGALANDKFFRAKLVLGCDDIDKYKKELKEVDGVVACTSIRIALENSRIKESKICYLSEYIDSRSIAEIKSYLEKLKEE